MLETPDYPKLGPSVAKYRRKGPIVAMDAETRRDYGEAVLRAIRGLNKGHSQRKATPLGAPHCASGTAHTTGEAILKAIKSSHRAALSKALEADHAMRKDWTHEDREQRYHAAMIARYGSLEAWLELRIQASLEAVTTALAA